MIDVLSSMKNVLSLMIDVLLVHVQEALSRRQLWRLKDAAGKPPGVIGWWPAHAVTFLDNHDTGSTQQHWPFPLEHLHEVG